MPVTPLRHFTPRVVRRRPQTIVLTLGQLVWWTVLVAVASGLVAANVVAITMLQSVLP